MALNDNLRILRIQMGISQDGLAARLGVSRQSVSKWETGTATPELDKLTAMAELFGVTLDELVLGDCGGAGGGEARPGAAARETIPRRRFAVGLALLCTSALAVLILMLFGAGLFAFVLASPLILCGIACLTVRRHAGFWCAVAAYFPAACYIEYSTGVGIFDIIAWVSGVEYANPMRAIVFLVLLLTDAAVIACGVRSFGSVRIAHSWPLWLGACVLLALAVTPHLLIYTQYYITASLASGWLSAIFDPWYNVSHIFLIAGCTLACLLVKGRRAQREG